MSEVSSDRTGPVYPWHAHSYVRGNLACGNMRENLLRWLTVQGRIHSETLLATIGTLTGFAAQNAALIKGEQATLQNGHVDKDSIVLARTTAGDSYLLGNQINAWLFGEGQEPFPLYGFAAGAVTATGVPLSALPASGEMVEYVSQTLGRPEFGQLRVDQENRPHLPVMHILKTFWPRACEIFRLPLPTGMNHPPETEIELDETYWPVILSLVANQLITQTASVLKPLVTYRIVMESAIFSSKIDPNLITPNRWLIEPIDGTLSVRKNPVWDMLRS